MAACSPRCHPRHNISGNSLRGGIGNVIGLGEKKEEWALAITGYIVSIPIFVDSAFVVLYPVAKALAKNSKRSLLTLGVALAGGLVVTHHTVPPTPGPLGVAGIFGVDLGAMLLSGMCFAVPCVLSMVLYAQWLAKRYPDFNREAFSDDELRDKLDTYIEQQEAKKLPSLFLSLLPIMLPLEEGVTSAGIILLVTGAGGTLGAILRTGLEALRQREPQEYAARGCAFSIDGAQYLLDHAPHLKAVGFDFISLASPSNAAHGVKAHQILLGMYSDAYICIIEDMTLAHIDANRLRRIIAMPLRVRGVDSGQVSILAELDD